MKRLRAALRRRASFIAAVTLCCAHAPLTAASTKSAAIEEIEVTGRAGYSPQLFEKSTTRIDASQIATAAAADISELLAQQANLARKSFSGNSTFSAIDLRGAGDTSVSNVLVLVDGIPMNSAGLGAADLSAVNIQQVASITIARGSASVRYGSGANQGVIAIESKAPGDQPRLWSHAEHGSYNRTQGSVGGSSTHARHHLAVDSRYEDSDGYRRFSRFRQSQNSVQYALQASDALQLTIRSLWQEDAYQLPGPLSRELAQRDPRRAAGNAPDQSGESQRRWTVAQLQHATTDGLSIRLQGSVRQDNNSFVRNALFHRSTPSGRDIIEQADHILRSEFDWQSQTHSLQILSGFEYRRVDYLRSQGGQRSLNAFSYDIEVDTRASYLMLAASPTQNSRLSMGYRHDTTTLAFAIDELTEDETSPQCDRVDFTVAGMTFTNFENCPLAGEPVLRERRRWQNEAFELKLDLSLGVRVNSWLSAAKTFRNPNADELALTDAGFNASPVLQPQVTDQFEWGLTAQLDSAELQLAAFFSRSEREIVFTEQSGEQANFNLDEPLVRSGGELQLAQQLGESWQLDLQLGYTDASLQARNTQLPLVARFNGSATLRWAPGKHTFISFSSRYSGPRRDGNDFDNTQARLPGHTVHNIRAGYRGEALSLYAGINNVGDKQYSDIGYSQSVYPAPARNVYAGVRYDLP